MGKKTTSNSNWPAWSDAKFWSFVRSGLRRKWIMWPPRFEALKKARRPIIGKRHKWEVKCSKCKKWCLQKNVQVDHIVPVGTLKSYSHLDSFVRKLFVPVEKLRILCKTCHLKKTLEERKIKNNEEM